MECLVLKIFYIQIYVRMIILTSRCGGIHEFCLAGRMAGKSDIFCHVFDTIN